jgi:signal transduction histidine kinase
MNDLSDIDSLSKQLDELMLENQQVLSIVSHDLRSPLNRIFALIQLMQMGATNLTPDQTEYLEKIHLIVADGLSMMRNLVDYRNLEYRTIDILSETFNVGELINSSVKSFKPIAIKKNLEIDAVCEQNLIVTTDKQCLSRVIDNLLSNAVKFSPPGKKIKIRADTLFINHVKIEVHDEAGGFLPEEKEKIFQKFQKLSTRPTAGESTTGLGLFIAKSMTEKIGGKITCTTTAKIGSLFSIELPKKIDQSNK